MVGLHGVGGREIKGRASVGAALVVAVGLSAMRSLGVANHDHTAHGGSGRVKHLSQGLENNAGALRVAEKEVFLVRTVLKSLLDGVQCVLNSSQFRDCKGLSEPSNLT
jgi:hypothetical protein